MKVNPDTQNACCWFWHLDVWETSLSIWPRSGRMKPMIHLYPLPTCPFHSLVQLLKHSKRSCNCFSVSAFLVSSTGRGGWVKHHRRIIDLTWKLQTDYWYSGEHSTTSWLEFFASVTLWCEIEIMMGNMVDLTLCVMAISLDIVLTEDY